ncbi:MULTISPECIES: hypothetical protein [Lactobacillaceae]|uniref:hypothetical protein n=1 Tax=Lactobacillaceae TaxID=33958 RepID=UPI0014570564|nr:hypothetical protein [Lactobacillus sp. HBUAS51381]NLR10645.1 hypothetical protein [Lactobacillus sp. HBUAS51381]
MPSQNNTDPHRRLIASTIPETDRSVGDHLQLSQTTDSSATVIPFPPHYGRELAEWVATVRDDPEFLQTLSASMPEFSLKALRHGDYVPASNGQLFDTRTGIFY